jgi:hypothetical protein
VEKRWYVVRAEGTGKGLSFILVLKWETHAGGGSPGTFPFDPRP